MIGSRNRLLGEVWLSWVDVENTMYRVSKPGEGGEAELRNLFPVRDLRISRREHLWSANVWSPLSLREGLTCSWHFGCPSTAHERPWLLSAPRFSVSFDGGSSRWTVFVATHTAAEMVEGLRRGMHRALLSPPRPSGIFPTTCGAESLSTAQCRTFFPKKPVPVDSRSLWRPDQAS